VSVAFTTPPLLSSSETGGDSENGRRWRDLEGLERGDETEVRHGGWGRRTLDIYQMEAGAFVF
jgi:hypothetical protein